MAGVVITAMTSRGSSVMRKVYDSSSGEYDRAAERLFIETIVKTDPFTVRLEYRSRAYLIAFSRRKLSAVIVDRLEALGGVNNIDFKVVTI